MVTSEFDTAGSRGAGHGEASQCRTRRGLAVSGLPPEKTPSILLVLVLRYPCPMLERIIEQRNHLPLPLYLPDQRLHGVRQVGFVPVR